MGYADAFQILLARCCWPEGAGPGQASLFAESCFNRFISACSQDTLYFLTRSEFTLSRKILIPSPPFFFIINYSSSKYLSPPLSASIPLPSIPQPLFEIIFIVIKLAP